MIYHTSDQDLSDNAVSDAPLAVNSCGGHAQVRPRSDDYSVRRPQGRHDYQLIYHVSGQAEYLLDNVWTTVHAGQAVLFRPGQPQFYVYRVHARPVCRWVHFSGADTEKILRRCGLDGMLFDLGDSTGIVTLFERLIHEHRTMPPCADILLPALMQELLAEVGRLYQIKRDEGGYRVQERIMRVMEYMHSHFDEPQSLEKYAAQCGMSLYHFAHAFTAITGQSPYACVTGLRLAHARDLLTGTHLPVAEIARACGYESALYFSRIFSRHCGCSPSRYRAQAEENQEQAYPKAPTRSV